MWLRPVTKEKVYEVEEIPEGNLVKTKEGKLGSVEVKETITENSIDVNMGAQNRAEATIGVRSRIRT